MSLQARVGSGAGQAGGAVAQPAAKAAVGPTEDYAYNWKTGLYHSEKSGFSYDPQTQYYISWDAQVRVFRRRVLRGGAVARRRCSCDRYFVAGLAGREV